MTQPESILQMLAFNEYTLTQQLAGITAEETLLQLPFRGNCLNWVMGHIVEARNYMLDLLDEERVWSEEKCRLYETRSAAITGPDDPHYDWDEILNAAEESLSRVRAKLEGMTAEQLSEEDGEGGTLGEQLIRMAWHEAYHVGQTEILRQLANKSDQAL